MAYGTREGKKEALEVSDREKMKHGYRKINSTERLYNIWRAMKARCLCKTSQYYDSYGGRGITVCDEWLNYPPFREWAYSNGYDENAPKWACTLDRIDNNANYEPSNCRWVSESIQMFNRRWKGNKAGARGVYITPKGRYGAMICVNRKQKYLGTYDRIEDAIQSRREAELKYFGFALDK